MFKKYGILLWLLCLFMPGVYAQEALSVLQRPITISVDSSSVENIIDRLVIENDLYFSYNPQILPTGLHSCHAEKMPLKNVLRKLLPGSDYQFEVIDNQIIIKRLEREPLRVSAQVIDRKSRDPVPYASVTIEGRASVPSPTPMAASIWLSRSDCSTTIFSSVVWAMWSSALHRTA